MVRGPQLLQRAQRGFRPAADRRVELIAENEALERDRLEGAIDKLRITIDEMLARGDIGQPLADALIDEYDRRVEAGTLYGHQILATAVATRCLSQLRACHGL